MGTWKGAAGSGCAAGTDPEHVLPDCALPRRREGARTGGRVQDPSCRRGRALHLAAADKRPPCPGLRLLLSLEAAGRRQRAIPAATPVSSFSLCPSGTASFALKAVNVWSHSSPFSLAALRV